MAVYAIGDIQGCYDPLRRLLDVLDFDPTQDKLWAVGDLVNRGPQSAQVLRLLMELGSSAVCVLGNHDLTLLAVAEGFIQTRPKDTFDSILEAPDRESLLDWLRHQPLLHHDAELDYTMVHAGLPPQWDLAQAQACAAELEAILRGPDYLWFLEHMFGSEPDQWQDDLQGMDRLRFIANGLTRMRYCNAEGVLCFSSKGPLGTQPPGFLPWFRVPGRKSAALNIVFGHWGTLGYHREPGISALETGCAWGHKLTALRLDAVAEPCCVDCADMRPVDYS